MKHIYESVYIQPDFLYGICFCGALYSALLIIIHGWTYTLWGDNIKAYHVIWILGVFALFYSKWRYEEKTERLIHGIATIVLIWFLHDMLSCLSVFTGRGIYFTTSWIPQTPQQIINLYVRDSVLVLVSFITIRNHLKFSVKGCLLLITQCVIWGYSGLTGNYSVLVMGSVLLLDVLPYTVLIE